MTSNPTIILTIENGKIVANVFAGVFKVSTPINTVADAEKLIADAIMNGQPVMKSSSLDFPTEYTTDPAVIDLANILTGNVATSLTEGK